MCSRPSKSERGFTLVELLVVIGVIAALIALLMPALSKARRHAQQVACASNLRQVAWAFLAYAQDNRGWFPAPADGFSPPHVEDWIYWQPNRDVTESRLYRYLGNSIEVLKCPAGPPERVPPAGRPPYPYNYSVNVYFTGDNHSTEFGSAGGWNRFPCKLSQVIAASQKILVLEEDVTGINDGSWTVLGLELPDARPSSVSVRHDRGREVGWSLVPGYDRAGRGNVAFADGHCEFFGREMLGFPAYVDPRYRP